MKERKRTIAFSEICTILLLMFVLYDKGSWRLDQEHKEVLLIAVTQILQMGSDNFASATENDVNVLHT
jgi:hypothetical protein